MSGFAICISAKTKSKLRGVINTCWNLDFGDFNLGKFR